MITKVRNTQRDDLIYPQLCYRIMGILFDVWLSLGAGHKEKIYEKAIAQGLRNNGLKFSEQVPTKLTYQKTTVGTYRFDFLIAEKIVLEIKVRNFFSKSDIEQLLAYLKSKKLKLGIIAHFTNTGVKFKRIVNLY